MQLSDTIEFRFRRRYGLTPQDPRFLELTPEEIIVDYWAHRHIDDPKLRTEDVNPDFEADLAQMEAQAAMLPDSDFETIADDRFGG